MEKKKKRNFSSLIVISAIVHIDLFMVALFYLYHMGYSFNDFAVTCFFSFWGIEVLALAGIKIGKAKYNQTYEDNLGNISEEEI